MIVVGSLIYIIGKRILSFVFVIQPRSLTVFIVKVDPAIQTTSNLAREASFLLISESRALALIFWNISSEGGIILLYSVYRDIFHLFFKLPFNSISGMLL
jgi:hypothetical protein